MKWLTHRFRGTQEALNIYIRAKTKKFDVVFKVDPDVDGLMSFLVMKREVMSDYPTSVKTEYTVTPNRQHGLIPEEVFENVLLINTDSAISREELKGLVDAGNYVISIDHHEVDSDELIYYKNEETGLEGVIINNSYSFEPEEFRFLSGCGMVANFANHFLTDRLTSGRNDAEEQFISDESVVATGISLLSDVRNIENEHAREILEKTFSTPWSEMRVLPGMAKFAERSTPYPYRKYPNYFDRNYIDYKFSPYYNACLQFNLGDYILDIMLNNDVEFIDAKSYRKDVMKLLKKHVKIGGDGSLSVMMVNLDEVEPPRFKGVSDYSLTNFIGVFANEQKKDKSVMIVALDDEGHLIRGSFRGAKENVNYRDILKSEGFEVQGHKGAFGIKGLHKEFNKDTIVGNIMAEEARVTSVENVVVMDKLLENLEKIEKMAKDNQFRLSQNYQRIYYRGIKANRDKMFPNMIIWLIDGLSVTSFNTELKVENALIEPVWSDGKLNLFLKER